MESLATLGGALPFCGRYDGLLYVRLNALGAYALGFAEHYELQAEESPKPLNENCMDLNKSERN